MKSKYFNSGNDGCKRNIGFLLIIMLIITSFSSCASSNVGQEPESDRYNRGDGINANPSTFNATRIFQDSSALSGGIDFGDVNNDGNSELVVVGWSNRATMVSYNASSAAWDNLLIWEDTSELMDAVIEDIDLTKTGAELVVGGYSNNLTLLSWDTTLKHWNNQTIWTSKYHIYGLTAGDIDPDYNGTELAVVDWKSPTITIVYNNGDKWLNNTLTVSEPLTNVEIGDIDPLHDGNELIAVGSNGSVLLITKENDDWNITTIWKDSIGLFNAEIAEFDDAHQGVELLVVGRSKNATELYRDPNNGNTWVVKNLWHAPGGLEGLAIGNFNPFYDGNEIAIGGYSNTATMLGRSVDNGAWTSIIMWSEHDPQETELNGVAVADFYPGYDGDEVAVVGYSGKVTMLVYEHPDFELRTPVGTKIIAPGEYTTFSINVDPVSDFNLDVILSLPDIPNGITYEFSQLTISSPDRSVLTLQTLPTITEATYTLTIHGGSPTSSGTGSGAPPPGSGLTHTLQVTLIVQAQTSPDFILQVDPLSNIIAYSENGNNIVVYNITIIPLNGFESNIILSLPGPLENVVLEFHPPIIKINQTSTDRTSQLKAEILKSAQINNFSLLIHAAMENGSILHIQSVYLNITAGEVSQPSDSETDSIESQNLMISVIVVIIIIFIIIILAISTTRSKSNDSEPKDKSRK